MKGPRGNIGSSTLTDVAYRYYQIRSPSARAKQIRKETPILQDDGGGKGKKKRKKVTSITPGVLETYDPIAALDFDLNHFDYRTIETSFTNCPKLTGSRGCSLWFTPGAALVHLRALKQQTVPETAELVTPTVISPTSNKRRSDERSHQVCGMPNCGCTDLNCPKGKSFVTCPRLSKAKKESNARIQYERRKEFLSACGIKGKTKDPSVKPRVCSCHTFKDGIPDTVGIKAATPSKRHAPVRDRRWSSLNLPVDPQLQQIQALLASVDELEKKNRDLTEQVITLQDQISTLKTQKQPLRSSILAKSPKNVWNLIRFSCIEHFYCYLDLLCNCDRTILENLQSIRYDRIEKHSDSYKNRTRLKEKYSHAKLNYIDEAFLYFMKKNGMTGEQLAFDFQISESSVTLIIIKWSVFEYRRMVALGNFLSYEEYCKLCPSE